MNIMRWLCVLCLCSGTTLWAAESNPAAVVETRLSKPMPTFTLKNLDGLEVCSTNYAGTTRIVWFFATWDKPCQSQLPALVELQRDVAGLNVLGLILDAKDPADVKMFCVTNHVNFPVLIADYGVIKDFGGLDAIPTLFVVEPHGVIVSRFVGLTDKPTLSKLLEAIRDSRP